MALVSPHANPSAGTLPPALDASQQSLGRAYQELSFHVDNTPLAVIEWDRDFRVVRWTGQSERVFGWTAEEVRGKRPFEWHFVHEADEAKISAVIDEMIEHRNPHNRQINRNYTKAGGIVWCEWHNSILLDEAGQLVSIMSLVMDVTERETAAEILARNEATLRTALESAGMFGWEWNLENKRVYYTADFASYFGLSPGPDYSDPIRAGDSVHPDDLPSITAAIEEAIANGERLVYTFRGRMPAEDGGDRWFTTQGQVVRNSDGKPTLMVAVTADVTARKRAEADRAALDRQIRDAQKWESLGILAGGVAHDFNNILTVVLGCAGLARKGLPAGSTATSHLEQIEKASRRAADLCRQLLAYAGRGQVVVCRADLNTVIRGSSSLLEIPTGKKATLEFDLDPNTPSVHVDVAQIKQILLNLVMNSAEAIGAASGTIRIRTAPIEVSTEPIGPGYRIAPAPGRYAKLEVADTGPGIAPEVQSRMFDPFFSTKFAGRGLGLAAVLGIVQAHKGAIRVETEPQRGTIVTILLPVSPEEFKAAPASTFKPHVPLSARHSGTALIIDDEIFVRELAASTLEEMGFSTLLAGDGGSGLELYRRNRENIRIVVVDVVMPGMGGEEVLEILQQLNPNLPVLLISGFTERRLSKGLGSGTRVEFLQKPFHPELLASTVERLVAGYALSATSSS